RRRRRAVGPGTPTPRARPSSARARGRRRSPPRAAGRARALEGRRQPSSSSWHARESPSKKVCGRCIHGGTSRRSGGVRIPHPGGSLHHQEHTMRSSTITATAAAAGLALVLAGAASASAAEGDATLSVLHGVPDLTVDVYVNGELTLDDFTPGDLAGPLELAAGTYAVAITASDAADASEPVLGPIDLPLEGGTSYTAVAHLDADGEPTASLFTNDTSNTAAGEGRLTVRHVA